MTCPGFSSLLEDLESRLPGLAWISISVKREGEGGGHQGTGGRTAPFPPTLNVLTPPPPG